MMKKKNKKFFKRIACVLGACAFALVGCLPFLPNGKASAEGDLIYPDYPIAETYHNPFAGAIFSRVVYDGVSSYNSFGNTFPDRLNLSRNLPYLDSSTRSYERLSYRMNSGTGYNAFCFRDIFDGITDSGNFEYVSYFPGQVPIDREAGELLWSFSFDRCFMSLAEFREFRIGHRYLYRTSSAINFWDTDNQTACRLDLTEFSYAIRFVDGSYSWNDYSNLSDVFSVTNQGYHYPFRNISVYCFEDFVYDDPAILGSDDAVEIPMVWVSGRFDCVATVDGNFSSVNTEIISYVLNQEGQPGGYAMWQSFYDELLIDRLNNLAVENNQLTYENIRLNQIIDSNALEVIYDVVEGFLQLELFPNFRMYMLLLISLGIMGFGLALKIIM